MAKAKKTAKAPQRPAARAPRPTNPGLYSFLFDYGHLRWGSRLSRQEHLYHQGRNALSLFIYGLLALALWFGGSLALALLTSGVHPFVPLAFGLLLYLPFLYIAFAALKLTVLRLHDFGFSGWWMLLALPLGFLQYQLTWLFPGSQYFLGLTSLAYLALLITPGPAAPNRFGTVQENRVVTPHRWIVFVPLVMWAVQWLGGMAAAFNHHVPPIN